MLNKIYNIFPAFILAALVSVGAVFAQGSVSVESKVDRNSILIGDVFKYSIIVTYNDDVQIQMPELASNLGMFEIRDYKVLDPVKADGMLVSQTDYELSTFDTGEYDIPEIEIGYTTKQDSIVKTIKTEPLTITVNSLNPEESGDIRDIKAPLVPPRDYTQYILYAVIGLLVIAAIFFAVYFYKRRKQGMAILPTRQKPPKPAHEQAMDALEALVKSDLLATGQIKEYFIRLSDIIRVYVQGRYYIYAPEMTTMQLIETMEKERIEKLHIDMMREFLDDCDLVKFAKYIPDAQEIEIVTELAFNFVKQTRLVIETPPEETLEKFIEGDQPEKNEVVVEQTTELLNTGKEN